MTKLYITFTMDCERVASESPLDGPETWHHSERSIHRFCRILLAHGIAPTLFVTPECGEKHSDMLIELAGQGVDLGMHVHPESLGDHRYTQCLGAYDRAGQREIIKQGLDMLSYSLPERPTSFRSGNFSASNETFSLLEEMGFEQGSVSDPGRNAPALAAVWLDAFADPHWANKNDKLKPGDLDYFEIPVTTDSTRSHPNGFPYELRIEHGTFSRWHLPIINQALDRMRIDRAEIHTLCIFTHNFIRYDDADAADTATLRDMIAYLDVLRGKYDVVPVTLRQLRSNILSQRNFR